MVDKASSSYQEDQRKRKHENTTSTSERAKFSRTLADPLKLGGRPPEITAAGQLGNPSFMKKVFQTEDSSRPSLEASQPKTEQTISHTFYHNSRTDSMWPDTSTYSQKNSPDTTPLSQDQVSQSSTRLTKIFDTSLNLERQQYPDTGQSDPPADNPSWIIWKDGIRPTAQAFWHESLNREKLTDTIKDLDQKIILLQGQKQEYATEQDTYEYKITSLTDQQETLRTTSPESFDPMDSYYDWPLAKNTRESYTQLESDIQKAQGDLGVCP